MLQNLFAMIPTMLKAPTKEAWFLLLFCRTGNCCWSFFFTIVAHSPATFWRIKTSRCLLVKEVKAK